MIFRETHIFDYDDQTTEAIQRVWGTDWTGFMEDISGVVDVQFKPATEFYTAASCLPRQGSAVKPSGLGHLRKAQAVYFCMARTACKTKWLEERLERGYHMSLVFIGKKSESWSIGKQLERVQKLQRIVDSSPSTNLLLFTDPICSLVFPIHDELTTAWLRWIPAVHMRYVNSQRSHAGRLEEFSMRKAHRLPQLSDCVANICIRTQWTVPVERALDHTVYVAEMYDRYRSRPMPGADYILPAVCRLVCAAPNPTRAMLHLIDHCDGIRIDTPDNYGYMYGKTERRALNATVINVPCHAHILELYRRVRATVARTCGTPIPSWDGRALPRDIVRMIGGWAFVAELQEWARAPKSVTSITTAAEQLYPIYETRA